MSAPAGAATAVAITLDMRAANLRWSVYLSVNRIDGKSWSDQDRAQYATDLGAVVKVSHTTFAGG